MAGYSGKPLVQKLGIKPGTTIAILNAPKGYERTLGKLPSVTRKSNARTAIDFVQFFTREKRELERRFAALAQALAPAGMPWISWPKKASGVATDLTEDVIRVRSEERRVGKECRWRRARWAVREKKRCER